MPVTLGAIGAATGLGEAIYGGIQANKLRKEANANVMPTYTIPQGVYTNQQLAEANQGGMSAAANQAYQNQAGQGLATVAAAEMRGGASPNQLSQAYGNYEEGEGNLAQYDDKIRLSNLQTLMNANSNLDAYKDKAWQINDYSKWANKAQALAQQMGAANNMEMSGINQVGGGLMGLAAKALQPSTDPNVTFNPTNNPMSPISPYTPSVSSSQGSMSGWGGNAPQMPQSGGYPFSDEDMMNTVSSFL